MTINKGVAANLRWAFSLMSHWFYKVIRFGGRELPAPVAELLS